LLSLTAYLVDTVVLIAIALISFRGTMAQKLVQQYPWRYERSGMLGWKEKGTS
jgi:branched-chain amino acid transport system ATP-binding protein